MALHEVVESVLGNLYLKDIGEWCKNLILRSLFFMIIALSSSSVFYIFVFVFVFDFLVFSFSDVSLLSSSLVIT